MYQKSNSIANWAFIEIDVCAVCVCIQELITCISNAVAVSGTPFTLSRRAFGRHSARIGSSSGSSSTAGVEVSAILIKSKDTYR